MQLYDLYGQLLKSAGMMKGGYWENIFEDAYKPWPRVNPDNYAIKKWYDPRDFKHAKMMDILRDYRHMITSKSTFLFCKKL